MIDATMYKIYLNNRASYLNKTVFLLINPVKY